MVVPWIENPAWKYAEVGKQIAAHDFCKWLKRLFLGIFNDETCLYRTDCQDRTYMKYIYLARHAKSSWDVPNMDDFDRPLNKRGMCDAPKMGEYLAEQRILPQSIVTSSAKRAHATAVSLATSMRIPPSVMEDDRIYAAFTPTLMTVIQQWDDRWERVMMVGHNPGIADIAAVLTDAEVGHVPTCTVMGLGLDVASWRDVEPACGSLQFKIVPKDVSIVR